MLRQTPQVLASKSSSGVCRNQVGHKLRRRNVGFKFLKDRPVPGGHVVLTQKWHWGDDKPWVRQPDYMPGKNVTLNRTYDLTSTTPGVMSVRRSLMDPTKKWIDVEEDIDKVWRSRGLQKYFFETSQLFSADREEELESNDPDWRLRVLKKASAAEKYVDPNLLVRGHVTSIDPTKREQEIF